MKIQIDGHGINVTPALRELTEKKLQKLISHYEKIINIHMVFKLDNEIEQTASANVTLPGHKINAHESSNDMYKTLDLVMHNLNVQLAKYKEKISQHRAS